MVTLYSLSIGVVLFVFVVAVDTYMYKSSFIDSFFYMFGTGIQTGDLISLFALCLGFGTAIIIDFRLKKNRRNTQ